MMHAKWWALGPCFLWWLTSCGMSTNRVDNGSVRPSNSETPVVFQETSVKRPSVQQTTPETLAAKPQQTVAESGGVGGDALAWVADQEEILKRLQLVQQDGQKVYEAFLANVEAWPTWWEILEIDWKATVLAAQQTSAMFASPSTVVRANLDRAKILQGITTAQTMLEDMVNTLNGGQNINPKHWQKLGEEFLNIASSFYENKTTSNGLRLRPQNANNATNGNNVLGPHPASAAAQTNTVEELTIIPEQAPATAQEQTPESAAEPTEGADEYSAVPFSVTDDPGQLSLVGLIL